MRRKGDLFGVAGSEGVLGEHVRGWKRGWCAPCAGLGLSSRPGGWEDGALGEEDIGCLLSLFITVRAI